MASRRSATAFKHHRFKGAGSRSKGKPIKYTDLTVSTAKLGLGCAPLMFRGCAFVIIAPLALAVVFAIGPYVLAAIAAWLLFKLLRGPLWALFTVIVVPFFDWLMQGLVFAVGRMWFWLRVAWLYAQVKRGHNISRQIQSRKLTARVVARPKSFKRLVVKQP